MRASVLIGLAAGFLSHRAAAACSSALKIDDFSKWSSNTNSLGEWTSDDSTMSSISASGGTLSFKPKASSYFYETFPCQQASSSGYNSVQFSIKGPAGGSCTLEIQTKSSCSASSYTSYWYDVSGLTGSLQTITVPLTSFSGANTNAVYAFTWSGFSSTSTTWQLGNIQFGCSSGSGGSSAVISSTRAASSSSTSRATFSSASASSSTRTTSTSSASSATSSSASLSSSTSSAVSSLPTGSSSSSSTRISSSSVSSTVSLSSTMTISSSTSASSSRVSSASSSSLASSSSSSSIRLSSSSSTRASSSSSPTSITPAAASSSSSSSSSSRTSSVPSTLITSALPSGSCQPLLIDDWISQSRLTFLYYNAMLEPTSDDGTMKSLVVGSPSSNRVTLTPNDTSSYFYSQFGCINAKNVYGGISLRIKAAAGTSFSVELQSSSKCDPGSTTNVDQTTSQLGWTFDGTEKVYSIPFSKYTNLDTSKLVTIFFSGFTKAVSFGPMAFYCGNTPSEYVISTTSPSAGPSSTVPAPSATAGALVIDKFASKDSNTLGFWHGADDGMGLTWGTNKLTIKSTDADYSFYTQVGSGCTDLSRYKGSYLHIAYSGTTAFTISLQQHNSQCNENIAPYPETWDSLEASRYANNGHIYIPINQFNVNLQRSVGFAIRSFYKSDPVTLSVIEIVNSVPSGFSVPNKLPSGNLMFACKRPNSFAFAIDDGDPALAQQVLSIIRQEDIKVTFFTVGAPLLDDSTNLTNVYREMQSQGHQIGLHSFTHPKMEGLPDYASIDWEYNQDVAAVAKQLNGLHTNYFRPPFGTEGARMRQRLATSLGTDSPWIVNWSVDVEDWLWAQTDTPEEQLKAFQRDVDKGGNLVVLHYLYPSTVGYLQQFIQIAKKTGKQLMRVDQCMEDPNAPAL